MELLDKRNIKIISGSIILLFAGFTLMKLEPAAHGYGPWALTVAPILIVTGFAIGIFSIFLPKSRKIQLTNKLFTATGWILFLGAFGIYLATLEPTASLWDCAEFIASAYKLQVPHPPGAPLFLLVGRLFSLLALGDPQKVAFWINVSSALSSALTVMFTFWTIIMLVQKINAKTNSFSLIVSGVVGAMSIAFADSFWFSAVEAETYAMATFFLILTYWSVLKWEKATTREAGNRWLMFIFYMLGLSVGVHPMSLLVIPAIAVIIMFRKRKFSFKYFLISVLCGAMGIFFLNHVILFGLPDAMKYADILLVNTVGLPFYSGAILVALLLILSGTFTYRRSLSRKRDFLSVTIVGLMYFLIGYSSYFMIIIRSQADPSVDEHNPENLMTLTSYLKRESYGGRPLWRGPDFTSSVSSLKKGTPVYTKFDNEYRITDHKSEYVYQGEDQHILPRMYSNQPRHIETYQQWAGLNPGEKPRFTDHMHYMIRYQLGHMFFRYFMFNFSGRESDVQHANWLSPIEVLKEQPDFIVNNKAHNNFLMLPLLLGLIGMIYQYKRDKVGFWSVMTFFLFLGLILVFYLNPPPNEPRERDYIYVGAWLAYAIWCGLGSFAIYKFIRNKFAYIRWASLFLAATLLVPAIMLVEGYDDHDRSGRSLQVDHARNTLASCAPNAILFTGGDNDTFPLWYVQEVEQLRTDVRVIVLSYFNGDWYVDQMRRKVYDSEPLPFSLDKKHYIQGGLNDVLPFVENPKITGPINLDRFMQLVREENRSLHVSMSGGDMYNCIPSRDFFLNVDKEQVVSAGIVPNAHEQNIPEQLHFSWKGNYLEKSAFLVLDLIANNQWQRPIYFNTTSLNSIAIDFKKHVLNEGLVYRLLPIELANEVGVNIDLMFENLMEKANYNDLGNTDMYYNHEDYQLRILQNLKREYNLLAAELVKLNQHKKAREVIDFTYSSFYTPNIKLDFNGVEMIDLLVKTDDHKSALDLGERLFQDAGHKLAYYKEGDQLASNGVQVQYYILRQLLEISKQQGFSDLEERCAAKVNEIVSQL